ncbi:ABC transporter permease [Sphingobacterium sp. MYb382]|uniref:ABC transporter permease n=1 Tax=Sphingobacterium sp. MYb382 TaxID=2745278 RepID=UPI0030A91BCE
MLKTYIKIAWRNLTKNPSFSFINITGLAIGLATCFLICLYVFDELSFDRFHTNANRIVRVVFQGTVPGGKINEANVMPPVAETLKQENPEVELATRLMVAGAPVFEVNGKLFSQEQLAFVDSTFFNLFSFPLTQGDANNVLKQPNTVVITERLAKKFFGTTAVIGKDIQTSDKKGRLKITGVLADIPKNSHIQFDLFASMSNQPDANSTSWMTSGYYTYLLLKPDFDYRILAKRLPDLFEKHAGPQFPAAFGMDYKSFRNSGNHIGLEIQPLKDIHLHSNFVSDLSPAGNSQYIYIFVCIAIFILCIATINFINLSTASASKRAKEVAVRKVLGSSRKTMVIQFLCEAILTTSLSLLMACVITWLALPVFNKVVEKDLNLNFLSNIYALPFFLGINLFVGILAGLYPALFLSNFKPLKIFRSATNMTDKNFGLRNILVTFQFFIAISFVIGTTVIYQQLTFIQQKDLGYNKDNLIVVQTWPLGDNQDVFIQQLKDDSRVSNLTRSGYIPAGSSYNNNFLIHDKQTPKNWIKTLRYDVDENYITTMGMQLIAGRNFSKAYGADSLTAIVNESAVKSFGWGNDILGKTIVDGQNKSLQIIGVVKDFNFKSLYEPITPLVMVLQPIAGDIIIKTKSADIESLIQAIKGKYESYNPEVPFSYSFIDQRLENTYATERRTSYLLITFSALTIFVACLGLLGLTTFAVSAKTKEIGIRKILGANIFNIMQLIVNSFVKLILIAFFIAAPLSWWITKQWLNDFAYRINLNGLVFICVGLFVLIIALLAVSWQVYQAARQNPTKSLRTE